MKAPVSACIIVKNEPLLEKCLKSIRDYVEEIVIVDTGSTDGTQEVAKKYADIFEVYTDCNNPETGLIENFSQARQRSFDLATKSWVMWLDGDDIIDGMDKLKNIVEEYEKNKDVFQLDGIAFLFPYEYSYNAAGQCTCKHYRERLFSDKNLFKWTNPVHEVAVPDNNKRISLVPREELVFKHQRQYSTKTFESGRNLRILKAYFEKIGDTDARQRYYLGLEYANVGMIDESIEHLTKYIEVSGWEDERVMACLKLVDIYFDLKKYNECIKWGFKAIEIKENWAEGYFALAKAFYFLALNGGNDEQRNWERCAYFAQTGLKLPPTKTLLFINPIERDAEIHKYLNLALNKIGDVKGALESVLTGMKAQPEDPYFLTNKKIYEDFLARQEIVKNLNTLVSNNTINKENINVILAAINNQPLPEEGVVFENKFPVAKVGKSEFDWKIPNVYDFSSYPLKLSKEQLQAVVLMIWKQYIVNDEVLSAISFLENAPYYVRHTAETIKALSMTKKYLDWNNDKDKFISLNTPINPNVESGILLPFPLSLDTQEGQRFHIMASRLEPNSFILDLGCMDGSFTNRYGLLGHKVVGVDAIQTSIDLAKRKAEEFNTNATYVCSLFKDMEQKIQDKFDYVLSSDTYEHLIDPVNDMLVPAAKMLKSNGKILLCTPYGAWMRGQYVEFADPWNLEKEGKNWLTPHLKSRIVAPTVWTVADNLRKAGFWVKDSFVSLASGAKDVENQGNILAEGYLQSPSNNNKLDIIIYCGDGVETWSPLTVRNTGIGGSELMALEMAKRLALSGHRVRLYNSCGEHGEGIYDGVEYYQSNKFQDLECDVLIISRQANMLEDRYNISAKLKLLWVHDVFALNANNELLLKADRIIALSHWHKQNLINVHNVHPDHIIVSRNGIDLNRFNKKLPRNKFKAINSSSPDRSWPVLLDIWPKIKERVPEAELHLFYGFKNWEYSAQFNPEHKNLIQYLKNKIFELQNQGVVYHDRVNQKQLADEFLSSGVILYPTWFSETSYIGGMEAQAAGLRFVGSSIAAINETVGDRGVLIPGDWTSESYKNAFIEAAVKALTDDDDSDRIRSQQYAISHFGLDDLANEWSQMFRQLLEIKKINPLNPYYPTESYR